MPAQRVRDKLEVGRNVEVAGLVVAVERLIERAIGVRVNQALTTEVLSPQHVAVRGKQRLVEIKQREGHVFARAGPGCGGSLSPARRRPAAAFRGESRAPYPFALPSRRPFHIIERSRGGDRCKACTGP